MSDRRTTALVYLRAVLTKLSGALICALPLLPLLDFHSTFYVDWFNHIWLIEYFGRYMGHHYSPPDVISTASLIGSPVPIFYSSKFYTIAGLVSRWIGAGTAFRMVAFGSMFIQFYHIEKAARGLNVRRIFSFPVAMMITWAVYPLTNLYNRSALTEFVAVAFLNASVASLFVLIMKVSRAERSRYDMVAFGLLYLISALIHPLTALFGGLFLALIGLAAVMALKCRWFLLVGIVHAGLALIVLAPWLYAVHRFAGSMPVSDSAINASWFRSEFFFPDSIDNFWSRISPVPLDLRSVELGVRTQSPYLDAQIVLPLVILGIALYWLWRKSNRGDVRSAERFLRVVCSCSAVLLILFLAVSVQPLLSILFGGIFDILQFPYRLTTYVNLSALTAVLALIALVDRSIKEPWQPPQWMTFVLGVCVTLSFSALVLKLVHADAIRCDDVAMNLKRLTHFPHLDLRAELPRREAAASEPNDLPRTFYGSFFYSVVKDLMRTVPSGFDNQQRVVFRPREDNLGQVPDVKVQLEAPTLVVTNIEPFPWNVLIVDGAAMHPNQLVALPDRSFPRWMNAVEIAVPLQAGNHVLGYQFRADRIWRQLNVASWIIFLLWTFSWLVTGISPNFGKVRNLLGNQLKVANLEMV